MQYIDGLPQNRRWRHGVGLREHDFFGETMMVRRASSADIFRNPVKDAFEGIDSQWRSEGPAGPATLGARDVESQGKFNSMTPWPGAQTICLRVGPKIVVTYTADSSDLAFPCTCTFSNVGNFLFQTFQKVFSWEFQMSWHTVQISILAEYRR